MSAMLVRGLPQGVHRKIRKLALAENLSVNQAVIRLLVTALERLELEQDKEQKRREVFERIRQLRVSLRQKYGRFEDSTKMIREGRDRRSGLL